LGILALIGIAFHQWRSSDAMMKRQRINSSAGKSNPKGFYERKMQQMRRRRNPLLLLSDWEREDDEYNYIYGWRTRQIRAINHGGKEKSS
jgi:hypothetical protein